MIEADLRARGPYSLHTSARGGSDATRVVAEGVYTATITVDDRLERVRAWQRGDGVVCVRAESEAGVEHARFILGLEDDHSEFLTRFAADPLLGETIRQLRGFRPLRTATVAHALLRAVAGQLITARRARAIERAIVRRATPALESLHAAPTAHDLGRFSPAELRDLGLGARRGAALVRLCRSLDLEALKGLPTDAVARRLERERPARGRGVILEGSVVARARPRPRQAASALWGRRVEPRTDVFLAPYGWVTSRASTCWRDTTGVQLGDAHRDPRRRQDRRVAPGRAA